MSKYWLALIYMAMLASSSVIAQGHTTVSNPIPCVEDEEPGEDEGGSDEGDTDKGDTDEGDEGGEDEGGEDGE